MSALATLGLFVSVAALQTPLVPQPPAPARMWVAFSAQLRYVTPDGLELTGRFFRDEHGCERRETPTGPQRSTIISIQNFEKQLFYQMMRDSWNVQPMRIAGGRPMPRRIGRPTGVKDTREGYDVIEVEIQVRGRAGSTARRMLVAPRLNDFPMQQDYNVSGLRETAHSIVEGPPDHSLFVPPAGVIITEREGFGGSMSFAAVELAITLPGRAPIQAVTTEETIYPLQLPSGDTVALVTTAIGDAHDRVRIRIMRNASGRPGAVKGDVIDDLELPLGGSSPTARLRENFEIRVVRIGMNRAPR